MSDFDIIQLTGEEYVALVNGRFQVRKCTICDGKGWYWVHEDGYRSEPRQGDNPDEFYRHPCEFDDNECGGYGFRVIYDFNAE